jgi:hypothetical protein
MGELVPAQAGRAAGPRRQAMTAIAVRGLSRFAGTRGIPAGWEFLLDYDVIEAFCVAGLAGRATASASPTTPPAPPASAPPSSASRAEVTAAGAHLGALIQAATASQVTTIITSDPAGMRLVARDANITIAAI